MPMLWGRGISERADEGVCSSRRSSLSIDLRAGRVCTAYIVVVYIVMAYIGMAYIVVAYIVMAYIVMAYAGTTTDARSSESDGPVEPRMPLKAVAIGQQHWINDAAYRSYYCGLTMLPTVHIIFGVCR